MTRSRSATVAAALVLSALALSACGSSEKKGPRFTCPDVLMERTTADVVVFRDGPGRDLTDVMYEAQLTGFTGDCERAKNATSVTVTIQPTFRVNRGPAWAGGTPALAYFTAIPAYYPSPDAKKVYSVPFTFPPGTATSVVLRDEKVFVDIPIPADGSKPAPVYLGFQLTADQLDYNRKTGGPQGR
ncbi:MAG: hypothetical protein WCZ23_14340 [Rhodospirillaceae bacterium]